MSNVISVGSPSHVGHAVIEKQPGCIAQFVPVSDLRRRVFIHHALTQCQIRPLERQPVVRFHVNDPGQCPRAVGGRSGAAHHAHGIDVPQQRQLALVSGALHHLVIHRESIHLVKVFVIRVADDSSKAKIGLRGVMQEELRIGNVDLQQMIQISGTRLLHVPRVELRHVDRRLAEINLGQPGGTRDFDIHELLKAQVAPIVRRGRS